MTTPDNPVVQTPQPNGTGHIRRRSKHEGSGSPDSENGEMPQKICRVCGDFATGYNFNVMTCESCKAFFRRNALRPKEFKCPYSENCTMSSVSRRFCQKCRLRKCFAVGMKKEFILNDEQLRRRKNSRLKNDKSTTTSSSPLTVNPMSPIIMNLPGGPQYPSTSSPAGSSASNSPINRSMTAMHVGDKISEEYVPNAMAHRLPQSSSLNSASNLEDGGQVILSAEEYENLLARIPADARSPGLMNEDEPSKKRPAYNPPANFDTASFGMGIVQANGSGGDEEMYRKMTQFYDRCIRTALDSPGNHGGQGQEAMMPKQEVTPPQPDGFDYDSYEYLPPINNVDLYQLNAAELKALDSVREAFFGLDDPMEQGRQMQSFLKVHKTPADIMNIMDVTMRRFVKVARGVNAFRDLTQDGKFILLKGAMVEMLTVRGVTRYDPVSNSFKTLTIKGEYVAVNMDDMFAKLSAANAQTQKAKCLEFFGFFDDEIKRNELAVHLVMLIILFTIRGNPIMDENDVRIVNEQRRHHKNLLNRYLESLYGEQAHRIIDRLPRALEMLNDIARNAGMLFMGCVRTGEAEDLPAEFFMIK